MTSKKSTVKKAEAKKVLVAAGIKPLTAFPIAAATAFKRETDGTYDLSSIADEGKGYGSRLRILKAMRGTDKVIVKDAEPARLGRELKVLFGAKNAGDLALKCAAALKNDEKATRAAAKADTERAEKARKQAAHENPIIDGKPVLPVVKRLNKKQRAAKEAEDKARLAREVRHAEEEEGRIGIAKPHPSAKIAVDMEAICLLEDPSNGVILMRLEHPNSQGAICVYNNGSRVAAGVVPTEVLNKLRSLTSTDIVRDVNQLLHPMTAGVIVTPVAERHLTAVLEHCKEDVEMKTKKAAETAAKTKKFAAPASAPVKAAKAAKPAKEAKVKKASKDGATTERKSSLFRLLNDTKTTWSAFATQKAEIVAAFVKLGAVGKTAAGVTRGALIAALPGVPDKNISFYLSKWQPAGIVEKLPAAE
jgi:hypothetical protein